MTHSILDTIGNTPVVEIRNLNPNPKVKILAKLEYFNPGGSIKDRSALRVKNRGSLRLIKPSLKPQVEIPESVLHLFVLLRDISFCLQCPMR